MLFEILKLSVQCYVMKWDSYIRYRIPESELIKTYWTHVAWSRFGSMAFYGDPEHEILPLASIITLSTPYNIIVRGHYDWKKRTTATANLPVKTSKGKTHTKKAHVLKRYISTKRCTLEPNHRRFRGNRFLDCTISTAWTCLTPTVSMASQSSRKEVILIISWGRKQALRTGLCLSLLLFSLIEFFGYSMLVVCGGRLTGIFSESSRYLYYLTVYIYMESWLW